MDFDIELGPLVKMRERLEPLTKAPLAHVSGKVVLEAPALCPLQPPLCLQDEAGPEAPLEAGTASAGAGSSKAFCGVSGKGKGGRARQFRSTKAAQEEDVDLS